MLYSQQRADTFRRSNERFLPLISIFISCAETESLEITKSDISVPSLLRAIHALRKHILEGETSVAPLDRSEVERRLASCTIRVIPTLTGESVRLDPPACLSVRQIEWNVRGTTIVPRASPKVPKLRIKWDLLDDPPPARWSPDELAVTEDEARATRSLGSLVEPQIELVEQPLENYLAVFRLIEAGWLANEVILVPRAPNITQEVLDAWTRDHPAIAIIEDQEHPHHYIIL